MTTQLIADPYFAIIKNDTAKPTANLSAETQTQNLKHPLEEPGAKNKKPSSDTNSTAPGPIKTQCRRCGRRLSNKKQVELGIGKVCATKEHIEKNINNARAEAAMQHIYNRMDEDGHETPITT